jgi:hypothetical protein
LGDRLRDVPDRALGAPKVPNECIPWKGGRIESYSGLLDENGQMVGVTDRVYAPDGVPIDDALRILALSPAG